MRVCSRCREKKEIEEFHVCRANKDGLNYHCKVCERKRKKRERSTPVGKEKARQRWNKYYRENKEKINAYNTEYRRRRRIEDPVFRLRRNTTKMIYKALNRQGMSRGGESFVKHLPYTLDEMKIHLETKFDENMSWNNYGSYWTLDHIIPQAALPYDSYDHPNFRKCWSLDNLQPLTVEENTKKNSFYNGKRVFYEAK
jgi:hypothetical protein